MRTSTGLTLDLDIDEELHALLTEAGVVSKRGTGYNSWYGDAMDKHLGCFDGDMN